MFQHQRTAHCIAEPLFLTQQLHTQKLVRERPSRDQQQRHQAFVSEYKGCKLMLLELLFDFSLPPINRFPVERLSNHIRTIRRCCVKKDAGRLIEAAADDYLLQTDIFGWLDQLVEG